MRQPNIIAMKAWLLALLLSYASAQEFIGLKTNGERRCADGSTDNSPNCDTSVQTTCVLENGEGCIGIKQPPLKGRYFIKTDTSICQTYPATITWEWCNNNDVPLVYAKNKAAVHYSNKNPDNNEFSLFDFKQARSLAPGACGTHSEDVVLDSCIQGRGVQWFDIILQGRINNGADRCFCYEFNQAFADIEEVPDTPPPSPAPTPKPNVCDGSDLMIVTVADPEDNKDARYIELYSEKCKGKTIDADLTLSRVAGRGLDPLRLQGHKVNTDGAIVVCVGDYWADLCDFNDGTAAIVAAVDSVDPIILENGLAIQDRYGFDNLSPTQSYDDGGAQRLCGSEGPKEYFYPMEWDITPGTGSLTRTANTFFPGFWKSCCESDGTPLCKTETGCYPEDILFTEFADPSDTISGRFIEMYSKKCAGQEVRDVELVRIPSEKFLYLNPDKMSLEGKEFDHDGFMVVCMVIDANTVYGRGKCDYFAGEVANADGISTFKLLDITTEKVLDIYGYEYDLSDTVPNPLPSDFSNGRAVRNQQPLKEGVKRNTHIWFPSQWMISKATSKDMDPGEWVDAPPILLLTEISYPRDNDLHFIEINSPNLQGTTIRDPLYLVTYSQGSSSPDPYPISLFGQKVGFDGFLLLCSTDYVSQAFFKNGACDIADVNLNNLHMLDAIAIVKGVVTSPHPAFDIIDIYGDIGTSPIAYDAGRAVRKFYATSPRSVYVPSDWIKMTMDIVFMSDPREWKYEKPINDGEGCEIKDLIITEIADPYDDKALRYIELYSPSTCAHGKKLGDFSIVSNTGSVGFQLNAISLKGVKLDEHGFLVICVSQSASYTPTKHCDHFAGPGSVVDNDGTHAVAVRYGTTIIDVYGGAFAAQSTMCLSTSGSGWYTGSNWHCFANGRVVRKKMFLKPSVDFDMNHWVIVTPVHWWICDPGQWTDPYCYVCDMPPTPVIAPTPSVITLSPISNPAPSPVQAPHYHPPQPVHVPHSQPVQVPHYHPQPVHVPHSQPVQVPHYHPQPVQTPHHHSPHPPTHVTPCSGFMCGNTCAGPYKTGKVCGKGKTHHKHKRGH